MAENWVHQCRAEKDPCDFVYEPRFTVGQAWTWLPQFPGKRWVQQSIQQWFQESAKVLESKILPLHPETGNNFTQVI